MTKRLPQWYYMASVKGHTAIIDALKKHLPETKHDSWYCYEVELLGHRHRVPGDLRYGEISPTPCDCKCHNGSAKSIAYADLKNYTKVETKVDLIELLSIGVQLITDGDPEKMDTLFKGVSSRVKGRIDEATNESTTARAGSPPQANEQLECNPP